MMRSQSWFVLAGLFALPSIALGTTFSVRAGSMIAASPARTSPSIEFASSTPFASARSRLETSVHAWTLTADDRTGARTELTVLLAPAWNGSITQRWGWMVGAGPTVRFADGAVDGAEWDVGLGVTPGLTMATRRRNLSLDLGARGLFFFNDSPRFSLVVGATYAFH